MALHPRPILALLLPLSLLASPLAPAADAPPKGKLKLDDFQTLAGKYDEVLELPRFERSAAELQHAVDDAIAQANAGLDKIGKQNLAEVAFATTVGALDDVETPVYNLASRIDLIRQTSQDAAVRDAAEEVVKKLQDWGVGIEYREDVYNAIQAFAKGEPKLAGEEAKLLADTLRDYRRAGLALPPAGRAEVEKMRKELAGVQTDFSGHVTAAVAPVKFTREELDGVPAEFLDSPKVKGADGAYTIMANETYQFLVVQDNAKREETRKQAYVARDSRAKDTNAPLFNKMLDLRNRIALKLGYKSWDDYQIEVKMAKTGADAAQFIDAVIAGTKPKFDAEVAEMAQRKAQDTGKADARVEVWDWRYYNNQIKKTRYTVDEEALRVYFPMEKVIAGMFNVYEKDFGLTFTEVEAPYKWVDDLRLFVCADADSGEPLGLFYFDLFPRKGKYNHFAMFPITSGKMRPDGKYQRPVVSLVCNFPPPGADGKPSLLTHDDVVTIFHEFGHALHGMVTRAKFNRYAGTNVPGDFVEAPSQMLENWAWDKTVLDSFAADYRDPSKKMPDAILGKMKEAKLATAGVYYRRQFSFAKLDLDLHGPHPLDQPYDAVAVSNADLEKVFLPIDPSTAMVASFDHLAGGYDAGYYGYAWAEAIAADMATVFRQSPGGFMDGGVGRKLREEIYQPGSSREVGESIEKFLGRKQSIDPFLANNLGLQKEKGAKGAGGSATGGPAVK